METRTRCRETVDQLGVKMRCVKAHEHDGNYHRWEGIGAPDDDDNGRRTEVIVEWRIR